MPDDPQGHFVRQGREAPEYRPTRGTEPGGDGGTGEEGLFASVGHRENDQSIRAWRAQTEYAGFLTREKELCDEITPGTMAWTSSGRRSGSAGPP